MMGVQSDGGTSFKLSHLHQGVAKGECPNAWEPFHHLGGQFSIGLLRFFRSNPDKDQSKDAIR